MVERARCGEPERAGAHAFGGDASHLGDLFGGRRLAVGAALAHHEQAQRAVAHLRGEVDVVRSALERIEVLGDAAPVPRQAFVQRGAGDVLDAFHQLDELVVVLRRTGANPTPQLPITIVVTPWPDDGWSCGSHVAWPS